MVRRLIPETHPTPVALTHRYDRAHIDQRNSGRWLPYYEIHHMVYCLHLSTSVPNRPHVIADTSSPLAREVFLPIRSTATRGGATPTARSAAPTGTSPA